MQDDLIVVDDVEDPRPPAVNGPTPGPSSKPSSSKPKHASTPAASSSRPRRAVTMTQTTPQVETSDRTTRSAAARSRPQPKLKLKLSEKAAAQAPGMSFLGPYDRELDSDEEELAFEEQFIIRMPPGDECERLRKMISEREVSNDVWFKFKDSRRAIFHIGNSTYSSKLVDLPCIIESQKTLDGKQMFKVADICQMLVVGDRVSNEESLTNQKTFNIEEFIWPHGITPPLHHVRKRRFRKRVNKRTIESVEQAVERLLEADALASETRYEILENINPDLSDSELIDHEEAVNPVTPGPPGSEVGDGITPGVDLGEGDGDGEDDSNDEGDGEIDEELAAELDLALGDEDEERDDDDDEDDEDESDDDDEDDDDESAQSRKLLNEEIRDLEVAVMKKESEIASSANPLIKRRFEDALKKLKADLDMKLSQREEMKEEQRLKKEGMSLGDPDTDPDIVGVGEQGELDGDLFGPEEPEMMEIV